MEWLLLLSWRPEKFWAIVRHGGFWEAAHTGRNAFLIAAPAPENRINLRWWFMIIVLSISWWQILVARCRGAEASWPAAFMVTHAIYRLHARTLMGTSVSFTKDTALDRLYDEWYYSLFGNTSQQREIRTTSSIARSKGDALYNFWKRLPQIHAWKMRGSFQNTLRDIFKVSRMPCLRHKKYDLSEDCRLPASKLPFMEFPPALLMMDIYCAAFYYMEYIFRYAIRFIDDYRQIILKIRCNATSN